MLSECYVIRPVEFSFNRLDAYAGMYVLPCAAAVRSVKTRFFFCKSERDIFVS